MRTVVQFIVGLWIGRVGTIAVLIVVGLLLAGAHPTHAPVPAQRAHEVMQHEEVLLQQGEEAQRQREYAQPGPPAPTAGWQP